MTKEKYFDLKTKIEESGLTPYTYFKKNNSNPTPFYDARKKYEKNTDEIKITKVKDDTTFAPINIDSDESVSINGFEIKGSHDLIKEIAVEFLKGTQHV